jgi:di/tricarboxylate transporter
MEVVLVLLIIAAAVYLFVTETFRVDFVALLVLGTLVLIGLLERVLPGMHPDKWITPEEGVSGVSNPAIITVAAIFVLSAGLQRTGGMTWSARLLGRLTRWPAVLLLVMMLTVGLVSVLINNRAAVAILLPLVNNCLRFPT